MWAAASTSAISHRLESEVSCHYNSKGISHLLIHPEHHFVFQTLDNIQWNASQSELSVQDNGIRPEMSTQECKLLCCSSSFGAG